MAQSLDTARRLSKTSIRGRRLGLDGDEFLVGVKDVRHVVTNATSSTTATNLPNHGLVSIITTTNDGWVLADPEVGVGVKIVTGSTSTGVHTVTCANATIFSSVSTTIGIISFIGGGGSCCELMGLTTAVWSLVSRTSTATVLLTSA